MLDVTSPEILARSHAAAVDVRAPVRAGSGAGRIWLMFAALLGLVSVPVLLHPLPPISDYINHLARMHVIAAGGGDADLARYYEIDWQIIPNLMMDLIVPFLARVMNIYVAGQVYTVASFALILSGTVALNRQLFGRWSLLPMIAFPVLYNNVFLVGTMNYVFGIGLMLWAVVAWVGLRERSAALRLPVSALFVAGLFFCHLFALGVYGLAVLAFELQRLWTGYEGLRRHWGRVAARRDLPLMLLDFVGAGLPFLAALPLLLMSPTSSLWQKNLTWDFPGKADGLIFVVETYSHGIAFLLTGIVAFAAGWVACRRLLSFHAFGWLLLTVGAAVYLALPNIMFDTYMVDQRLPISLIFLLIACIDVELRQCSLRRAALALLVLLPALRVAEVETEWHGLSAGIESFRQSVQLLDRGAKVMVAYADPDGGDDVRDLGLVHADCIAIIDRSALVTTAFTVVGKQIMHARPAYRGRVDTADGTPPVIDDLVSVADHETTDHVSYWRHWTKDYDYVYVLFTDPGYENPDPSHLSQVFAGDRFVLYRVVSRPSVAEAGKIVQ